MVYFKILGPLAYLQGLLCRIKKNKKTYYEVFKQKVKKKVIRLEKKSASNK